MKLKHFPFPSRNPAYQDYEIYYIKNETREYLQFCYDKNTNQDAVSISNQYFAIEKLLMDSFQYVMPIYKNAKTCSVRFATIIRESANLYEIIARKTYSKFYSYESEAKLNIFNFLSLEYYLDLSKEELRSPLLETYNEANQKIKPFESMISWNKQEKLTQEFVPKWWTAYNKIKHDTESIIDYANLNNAIYSMAALFILIRKIYGEGLICGFLRKPSELNLNDTILYQIRTSDIFIGEVLKTKNNIPK